MSSDDEWDNPWDDDPLDAPDANGNREDRENAFGAQHVLILIDCRPSMFEQTISIGEDGVFVSPMDVALDVCEKFLRSKVKQVATNKTGKRDGVGILLYGVPNPTQVTTTRALVELDRPGIASIQKIQSYMLQPESLKTDYNLNDRSNVAPWTFRKAVQEASSAIAKAEIVKDRTPSSKALPDGKSLWIFTNDDNPLQDEAEDGRDKVEKAVTDIIENGVDIHLWPMKTPFNSEFYDSILTSPVETQEEIFDWEDFMDRIKREFRKQRVSLRCPMLLPDWKNRPNDPGIAIDFFKPMQLQKKPQPTVIHQETKKETHKVTNILDMATGEILHSTQDSKEEAAKRQGERIRTVTEFAGRMVELGTEDKDNMKKMANANQEKACLILCGFKPQDSLPLHYKVDEMPYYLYPNDDRVKGSTAAFANLHAAMVRKGVYAIGELLTKVSATSRLVAIFPQKETYDGDLEMPYCMVAYVLPFEDDMRELGPDSGEATDATVQAAMEMISAMNFEGFSTDCFKNDALEHFYQYMESIALNVNLPPPDESLKQIKDEEVRTIAGKQIDAFLVSLPEDIVVKKEPKKRKREPDTSGRDWVSLYKSSEVGDCTVTELKLYLKSTGEKLAGKKADLVERVSESIVARIASGDLKNV